MTKGMHAKKLGLCCSLTPVHTDYQIITVKGKHEWAVKCLKEI